MGKWVGIEISITVNNAFVQGLARGVSLSAVVLFLA
jgi:hypothetical protein